MNCDYKELCCMTCSVPLNVWYVDSGAPHSCWYQCHECKEKDEAENDMAGE
jgi:hypothetical protein